MQYIIIMCLIVFIIMVFFVTVWTYSPTVSPLLSLPPNPCSIIGTLALSLGCSREELSKIVRKYPR